jgi:hypothetical protein
MKNQIARIILTCFLLSPVRMRVIKSTVILAKCRSGFDIVMALPFTWLSRQTYYTTRFLVSTYPLEWDCLPDDQSR